MRSWTGALLLSIYKDGSQTPTLRARPGDWLILYLKNGLTTPDPAHVSHGMMPFTPRPAQALACYRFPQIYISTA